MPKRKRGGGAEPTKKNTNNNNEPTTQSNNKKRNKNSNRDTLDNLIKVLSRLHSNTITMIKDGNFTEDKLPDMVKEMLSAQLELTRIVKSKILEPELEKLLKEVVERKNLYGLAGKALEQDRGAEVGTALTDATRQKVIQQIENYPGTAHQQTGYRPTTTGSWRTPGARGDPTRYSYPGGPLTQP